MRYGSFPDLTGKTFGQLTILDEKLPRPKIKVRCSCGTEKTVSKYDVFNGKIKSCGNKNCAGRIQDLKGQQFGLLLVLNLSNNEKDIVGRCAQWDCQCDCGTIITVPSNQLTSGRTKSCGCSKSLWISEKNSIPIKDRVENELFSVYQENAKKRRYGFFLSKEEFVSFLYSRCFYCGDAPSNFMKKEKVTGPEIHYFNGIDRVNNKEGYSIDNCVTCCKLCNHAKNNLSKEEFIILCKKVANKF